ncbi:sulfotransferase [Micromonospora sp. WMMD882]|uniref:sulfotransferase n=1 Tax=Micromonospora sp. WMMD882 TaxID=3015151 RepID=UPI00248AC8FD|nr:sulfotransferase [Micromonospora sp. WMMD882]WBB78078.1 sulfotransferase [Micromonospora sp. WMMD882]
MTAQALRILDKVSPGEFFPAVPQNFVVRADGQLPARDLLDRPDVSLHCLDLDERRAYFVETTPGVDLTRAPFLYLAQYRHARRLFAVPFDTLHRLAGEAPDPARLILTYSVGRCGSTAVSHALGAVAGVRGYSEPDVFTQLTLLRYEQPGRDDDVAELIRSCVRLLGRGAGTLAVKFRAGGVQLADLFHRVFPDARAIFLYRHAERWLESMHAGFTPHLPDPAEQRTFLRYAAAQAPLLMPFALRRQRPPTPVEAYLLTWLSVMDAGLRLGRAGVPLRPVRYEDLAADPAATLAGLLAYCGLPADGIEAAYRTLAVDSQEGTLLSRASRRLAGTPGLRDEEYAQARAVLAEHPTIDVPDFVVPDFV